MKAVAPAAQPGYGRSRQAVNVIAIDDVAPRVKRFRLEPRDGGQLPAFSAGSHVTVHMSDGIRAWRNPYSLINAPGETRHYEIAVLRVEASHGGSRFFHDDVQIGDVLHIESPVNSFPIARHARRHILIAGGIGITPCLSFLSDLGKRGADFKLHYAFRDATSGAFAGSICAEYGSRAQFYVSSAGERIRPDLILADEPLGTHVYVCGPHSLIDAVTLAARHHGWPHRNVHIEQFTPSPVEDARPFSVHIPSAGASVRVDAGQSLLAGLEKAGIAIPSSCRVGRCGTCEVRVLDGDPEHRDSCLTDDERQTGRMLACVSRARGETLVLEVAPA